jgi:hypothetical protein
MELRRYATVITTVIDSRVLSKVCAEAWGLTERHLKALQKTYEILGRFRKAQRADTADGGSETGE